MSKYVLDFTYETFDSYEEAMEDMASWYQNEFDDWLKAQPNLVSKLKSFNPKMTIDECITELYNEALEEEFPDFYCEIDEDEAEEFIEGFEEYEEGE